MHKLWKREFDRLLAELQPLLGGTIITPKLPDRHLPRAIQSSYWAYPRFVAHIDNHHAELTISEVASSRETAVIGAEDEYLRYSVMGEFGTKFAVTHEGILSRMKEFLKLDFEFHTGHQVFDDKYYLSAISEVAKAALRNHDVQQCIIALEPFDAVEIRERSAAVSRGVKSEDDLLPEAVQQTFAGLVRLADLLSQGSA